MNAPLRVAVFGVTGRMGRCLVRAIAESPDFALAGALAGPGAAELGRDAGEATGLGRRFGVAVTDDRTSALAHAEAVVDFTLAAAVEDNVGACVARGVALLLGTTGLGPQQHAALEAAARRIPLIQAANTSLGVNLLAHLVRQAAASLTTAYDIEVIEAHHRHKLDAPSGTALLLGEAAAAGRGGTLATLGAGVRGPARGERVEGSVGFAVVRGGDLVGEHTVLFAGPGERLELGHRAHDRMTFAWGALRAIRWLTGRAPGRYSMDQVLGLA